MNMHYNVRVLHREKLYVEELFLPHKERVKNQLSINYNFSDTHRKTQSGYSSFKKKKTKQTKPETQCLVYI